MYNKPKDRFKEALHPLRKKYHKEFFALNNLNFDIFAGDCVGIIGKNGAGKSTLLKIITGVLTPTEGEVIVNGKIASILELGSGFNPDMTGLDNVYLNGAMMGLSKEEVDNKINAILKFADIGDFIHQEFKTYSSGMAARLSFSVAIHVEPDILIVDEALAVGDMFFQAKSMAMMKSLIENQHITVLFVSHDISSIKSLCSTAILLENGSIKMYDSAEKVSEEYFALRFDSEPDSQQQQKRIKQNSKNQLNNKPTSNELLYSDGEFKKTSSFQRIQNGKANFTNVILLDENEKRIQQAEFGKTVILRCFLTAYKDIDNLSFGFHVRNRNGVDILYDDTVLQQHKNLPVKCNDEYIISWKFKVLLQAAQYTVSVVSSIPINLAVADVDMCDFVPIALQFDVLSSGANVYAATYANSSLELTKVIL